jgi:hypothetical protein
LIAGFLLCSTAWLRCEGGIAAAETPTVFWTSGFVSPGQSVMLVGGTFTKEITRVVGVRLADPKAARVPRGSKPVKGPGNAPALALLNVTPQSVTAVIPENWRPGVFVVWVGNGSSWSRPVFLNRARPEWLADEIAQAGSELSAVGKNLVSGRQGKETRVVLMTEGRSYPAEVLLANPYQLKFRLPSALPEGDYRVWVHNGQGGELGWGEPLPLKVARATPWPQTFLDVKVLGARGDGSADDTAFVQTALAKARANGGGVVFFPPGVYRLREMLSVPTKTVLRGAGRDAVWLYWPKATTFKDMPDIPAVITGERQFGLEDLSLIFQMPLHGIVAPFDREGAKQNDPLGGISTSRMRQAGEVFIRRCNIRHLRFASRVYPNDKRRESTGDWGGETISLAGDRLEITDSDIVSWGMPLSLRRTRFSRITGNVLGTGRSGWYGIHGGQNVIFENNLIEARDLEGTGGGFNWGGWDLARIYAGGNRYRNTYGCEREALTFDNNNIRGKWLGYASRIEPEKLSFAGASWKHGELAGLQCLIVYGKGIGQCRTVVTNETAQAVMDRPWDILPDATSVFSVATLPRDIIVYDNDAQDASVGVQLWGAAYNFVIDGNHSLRAGGFWGAGGMRGSAVPPKGKGNYQPASPIYFAQFLNDRVDDGFVYDQGPSDGNVSLALIGLITGVDRGEGIPVMSSLGTIIRNNRLENRARIALRTGYSGPASATQGNVIADSLIEGNTMKEGPLGIEIGAGISGIVLRNNRFERVAIPIRDDGATTVKVR